MSSLVERNWSMLVVRCDIADELHLSIKTIEYYREQIKKKLNLKSASELTQYATSWVEREEPT